MAADPSPLSSPSKDIMAKAPRTVIRAGGRAFAVVPSYLRDHDRRVAAYVAKAKATGKPVDTLSVTPTL